MYSGWAEKAGIKHPGIRQHISGVSSSIAKNRRHLHQKQSSVAGTIERKGPLNYADLPS